MQFGKEMFILPDITLYQFSKRENSTKRPTGGVTVDCVLKTPTSKEAPTIILNNQYADYTYAYMLGHYYFMSEPTYINNDLVSFDLTNDVLATYKNEIGAYNGFIERSSSLYNDMIKDTALSQTEDLLSITSASTTCFSIENESYVLGVVSGLGVQMVACSSPSDVLSNAFNTTTWGGIIPSEVAKATFNPFQYITNCIKIPLSLSEISNPLSYQIGWAQTLFEGSIAKPVYYMEVNVEMPVNQYDDFRAYDNAFSKYSIYIPGCGTTALDASLCMEGLKVFFFISPWTGDTVARIVTTSEEYITSLYGNIATRVQIGQVPEPIGQFIDTAANITLGVASTAGNAMIGNYVGAALGAVNTSTSVIEGTLKAFNQPPRLAGALSASPELAISPDIQVTLINLDSADFPLAVYGRPLKTFKTINTLSGFVKCSGASIDISCSASDRAQINSYLNSGFYYE